MQLPITSIIIKRFRSIPSEQVVVSTHSPDVLDTESVGGMSSALRARRVAGERE